MVHSEQISRKMLLSAVSRLNDEEISAQALLIGAENYLRGETQAGKALSLLEFCIRRKRVKDLVKNLKEFRPDIWTELTSSSQLDRVIEISIIVRLGPSLSN